MNTVREPNATAPLEVAHVLFMDIVAYSMLPMDEQIRLLDQLQKIVRNTAEFNRACKRRQLLRLPTGDGMALVFFGDAEGAARCALEVGQALRSQPDLKLRMGIHTGPVRRVEDINANRNVAGGGINLAQRVMDCGDAGHILVSKSVADVLGPIASWNATLHDLGEVRVKHGVGVHLFNLYTCDAGNPNLPHKVQTTAQTKAIHTSAIVGAAAAVLLTGLGTFYFLTRPERGHHASEVLSSAPSAPVHARRSVAVLGFKNVSGRADEAWLSTALSEMLVTELAAGEQLRIVPGENVAQMKINLALPDEDSYGRETLAKIYKNLNADDIVLGSYIPLGDGKLRVDLRLQDAVQGETLASVSEQGSAGEIDALASRAGAALRARLGASAVSDAEAAAVKASLPSDPEAARLYSEGLAKLRLFDALAARDLLEKSVAADATYPLAHSALALAWSTLGYDAMAKQQAEKASELSGNLPREQRLWVEGRYRETTHEWPKAIDAYKSLQDFFPDNVEYGLRLVEVQTTASQGKDALETLAQLRRLPAPAGEDPRIDLAEANTAIALGDFRRAQEAAGLAATKGEALGAFSLMARARLTEGTALQNLGKMKEAVRAAEEAKKFFADAGDRGGVASALLNLGTLLYATGDTAGAKRAWEESLSISRSIGFQADIQLAVNNLATVLWHKGDLAGAKVLFSQSLEISKKRGDARGEARTMNNFAGLLHQQGDLPAAQQMEQSSLDVYRRIGDKSSTASALSNLGMLLSEEGNLPESRARYEESLALYREIGEAAGVASVTNSLGNLLYMRSNFPEARAMYEQSLAAYTGLGDKTGMLEVQDNLGSVLYDLGDLSGAGKLYEQALALARETQDKSAVAEVLASIGNLRETQGDLAGAGKSYEEALALRKEIGEKGGIADSRLSIASLMIEQGHPAAAESSARDAAQEFHQENSTVEEEAALGVLARSLLLQGKTRAAAETIVQAQKLAAKSEERASRTMIAIVAARIDAASGATGTAEQSLASLLSEAVVLGDVPTQLEVRLALGEVEIKSGKVDSGRTSLATLEKDATAQGLLLIARKAAAVQK
ncbi:MAG: tetratricopeptide repeat protein [Candidatus Acidiferrales bacterium]